MEEGRSDSRRPGGRARILSPCPIQPRRPVRGDGDQPTRSPSPRRCRARTVRPALLGVTGSARPSRWQRSSRRPTANARDRPQQDAGRAALCRVPRVLPAQRRRVIRQLLRLLPARGVPSPERYVHREGLEPQRRDRPVAARGDLRAVRAARCDHRRERLVHLWPRPPSTTAPRARAARRRQDRREPCCAPRRPLVPAQRPGADPRPVPVRGDMLELQPASRTGRPYRVSLGDEVERISEWTC